MNSQFILVLLALLFLVFVYHTPVESFDEPELDCALVKTPRQADRFLPFATSNGTLKWLTSHPSYYQKYYHGYFPWSTDDYAEYSPFDVGSPYFFLN